MPPSWAGPTSTPHLDKSHGSRQISLPPYQCCRRKRSALTVKVGAVPCERCNVCNGQKKIGLNREMSKMSGFVQQELPSLPRHVLDTALMHAFRKAQCEVEYAASRDGALRKSKISKSRCGSGISSGRFVLRSSPTPWTTEVLNYDESKGEMIKSTQQNR